MRKGKKLLILCAVCVILGAQYTLAGDPPLPLIKASHGLMHICK